MLLGGAHGGPTGWCAFTVSPDTIGMCCVPMCCWGGTHGVPAGCWASAVSPCRRAGAVHFSFHCTFRSLC